MILSESVSSLSLYLQEMDVNRIRDDVKTEALAARCGMEPRNTGVRPREVVSLRENCNNGDEVLLWFCEEGTMEKVVQVIPARKAGAGDGEQGTVDEREKRKLRVAAYCRVSTEQEEQLGSFANQVEYYTRLIESEEDWELAGIYADEGISGTGTRKRKGFQRLIEACDAGKVDFVITKSISRFARNTADCLVYARQLRDRGIPILFQKECINTMEASGELLFTILSCFAQEESRSISENTKWGIRSKFQKGIPHVNTTRLFGVNKDADGQLCVDPEQEVRRVMSAAWAQLVENRAVYEMKWRAMMESSETLALEKVRARQMMALMESADGPGNRIAGMRNGLDGDAAGEKWGEHFSKAERMTEVPWRSDVWIRMVLKYMIAGEGEYRVGFLNGSEVTVRVDQLRH